MVATVLIGPMGAGKTTLGKKLSKKLGLSFVDTDRFIARDHGSITRLFEKHGEEHFRELETSYLACAHPCLFFRLLSVLCSPSHSFHTLSHLSQKHYR